jgi:hypothetical protein
MKWELTFTADQARQRLGMAIPPEAGGLPVIFTVEVDDERLLDLAATAARLKGGKTTCKSGLVTVQRGRRRG